MLVVCYACFCDYDINLRIMEMGSVNNYDLLLRHELCLSRAIIVVPYCLVLEIEYVLKREIKEKKEKKKRKKGRKKSECACY